MKYIKILCKLGETCGAYEWIKIKILWKKLKRFNTKSIDNFEKSVKMLQ